MLCACDMHVYAIGKLHDYITHLRDMPIYGITQNKNSNEMYWKLLQASTSWATKTVYILLYISINFIWL